MSSVEKQCEVSGLAAKMLNNGFTLSFWLNINAAQMLHINEIFYILRLISLEGRREFRVFANNSNLFIGYSDAEGSVSFTPYLLMFGRRSFCRWSMRLRIVRSSVSSESDRERHRPLILK
jgi:hypothetical protein